MAIRTTCVTCGDHLTLFNKEQGHSMCTWCDKNVLKVDLGRRKFVQQHHRVKRINGTTDGFDREHLWHEFVGEVHSARNNQDRRAHRSHELIGFIDDEGIWFETDMFDFEPDPELDRMNFTDFAPSWHRLRDSDFTRTVRRNQFIGFPQRRNDELVAFCA